MSATFPTCYIRLDTQVEISRDLLTTFSLHLLHPQISSVWSSFLGFTCLLDNITNFIYSELIKSSWRSLSMLNRSLCANTRKSWIFYQSLPCFIQTIHGPVVHKPRHWVHR
jgi:hypothetical protein